METTLTHHYEEILFKVEETASASEETYVISIV